MRVRLVLALVQLASRFGVVLGVIAVTGALAVAGHRLRGARAPRVPGVDLVHDPESHPLLDRRIHARAVALVFVGLVPSQRAAPQLHFPRSKTMGEEVPGILLRVIADAESHKCAVGWLHDTRACGRSGIEPWATATRGRR